MTVSSSTSNSNILQGLRRAKTSNDCNICSPRHSLIINKTTTKIRSSQPGGICKDIFLLAALSPSCGGKLQQGAAGIRRGYRWLVLRLTGNPKTGTVSVHDCTQPPIIYLITAQRVKSRGEKGDASRRLGASVKRAKAFGSCKTVTQVHDGKAAATQGGAAAPRAGAGASGFRVLAKRLTTAFVKSSA